MNTSTIAIAENTQSVCSVFIFVILFIMIHTALKHSQMFSERTTGVLSFCAAFLSMIGLGQMFALPLAGFDSLPIPVVLIPYGLLGLFLILTLLTMLLVKRGSSSKTDEPAGDVSIPKLTFPRKQTTKPFAPMDFPMDLNARSKPIPAAKPDWLNQASRAINSSEQMKPNPKPSESKGIRYEK
jgi:hypothetical protein